jgi:CrcB protein
VITAVGFVCLAGLGAVARAVLGHRYNRHEGFPTGTLLVNLTGSFALGLLHGVGPPAATILGVGFLGTFTTFSSFARDSVALVQLGRTGLALGYVLLSVVGAILAAAAGSALVG